MMIQYILKLSLFSIDRLLVQFSFHLNADAEVETKNEPKSPVTKEGVCDMLVKYHLFSWDI